MKSQRKNDSGLHQLHGCGVGGEGTVKRNQRMEEGGGGGGGRMLAGGLGVTLMECHSTLEWRKAGNQSNAAQEFNSSEAEHPQLRHY